MDTVLQETRDEWRVPSGWWVEKTRTVENHSTWQFWKPPENMR